MYGLVHMFSWPTYFLTIAPDDLNSTLLIQLALRGRPTQIADYLNPNNSALRSKLTAESPVASVVAYHSLVERIFTYLVGIRLSSTTRDEKNSPHQQPIGVLGRAKAVFLVNEAQECPPTESWKYKERYHDIAESVLRHSHVPSCRKVKLGSISCRFGMPRAQCTATNSISLDFNEDKQIVVVDEPIIGDRFDENDPILLLDKRPILVITNLIY